MGTPWASALTTVADHLTSNHLKWLLLGSAATTLHGVPLTPADLDIAVRTPADVHRAAAVMPTPGTITEFSHDGESWTLGRWSIAGVKVELAFIDAPAVADLLLEARSLAVWPERVTLHCDGRPIPTVPIEVQLATMVAREQAERIEATLGAIGALNLPLLRRALADRQADVPSMTVPESLQVLLARV
ncbi:hypothetical protein ACFTSF_09160 [Kribbella sp. NPDC056951]|uniref:hypothetical protein n=1 Tax=Kribbella sp. NPDC056951 TaxID=3345978 RepID=UPI00362FB4CD